MILGKEGDSKKLHPRHKTGLQGRTSAGIPQFQLVIIAAAQDSAAVRREGAGADVMRVPAQRALLSTCQNERDAGPCQAPRITSTVNVLGTRDVSFGATLEPLYIKKQPKIGVLRGGKRRTGPRIPQLERTIVAAAQHCGAVGAEGAGADRLGVPPQGALFHTCQEGRNSGSDSSILFRHTGNRHGTTLRSTQEIKRNLKAPWRRAPVAASQILSVVS